MKKIAIITARAGSKGLPDKNMLMVDGKPLLSYTIDPAIESDLFDKIILSTDSQEYIDLLSSFNYPPPIRRKIVLYVAPCTSCTRYLDFV